MMRRMILSVLLLFLPAMEYNVAMGENVVPRRKVVVIDAGHGGPKFPGASYKGVYEKTLNLQIALRLGKMIEDGMPDVEVVYTRKKDMQFSDVLNLDLQKRASIANDDSNGHARRGDLFISIHANAARDVSVTGTETLIMGESSLETSRNEEVLFANNKEEFIDMADAKTAAVARAYIQNLQFTYGEYSEAMARIVQKNYTAIGRRSRGVKHQPLKVLYATDMPSILTEVGFMSNAKELAYMRSEKGQTELARALYLSVREYFDFVDGVSGAGEVTAADGAADSQPADTVAQSSAQPERDAPAAEEPKSGYTVQIMALAKRISTDSREFRGQGRRVKLYAAEDKKSKFPYRYCIGEFADADEARRESNELRRMFPGAFVVKYADGRIVK